MRSRTRNHCPREGERADEGRAEAVVRVPGARPDIRQGTSVNRIIDVVVVYHHVFLVGNHGEIMHTYLCLNLIGYILSTAAIFKL